MFFQAQSVWDQSLATLDKLLEEFSDGGLMLRLAHEGLEPHRRDAQTLKLLHEREAISFTEHTLLGSQIIYSSRQSAKYRQFLTGFDINLLTPSNPDLEIQYNFFAVFYC